MALSLELGPARVLFTERADGDFRGDQGSAGPGGIEGLAPGMAWHTAHQVHGSGVVTVDDRRRSGGAGEADALVTTQAQRAVAVRTADCAPVALASPEGVVAVVHAGWQGLLAGVVAAAVDHLHSLGASSVQAALGPCIHAGCYEFSPHDLDRVAMRLGDCVRSTTTAGRPALDVPAAVRSALDRAGADLVADVDRCTACDVEEGGHRWFSHRARGDTGRMATVVWRP